eukprot:Em0016g301a
MAENGVIAEGVLFGMCNPLLDISAIVPSEYLDKYGLKQNDAILAEPRHMPIYRELVDQYTVDYIAGGSGQNAIRVAQWMLQKRFATSYIGCVGKDEFGEQLERQATGDGVRVRYLVDEKEPTGTCACLITKKVRSLVANLGAANHYKVEHLEMPENWALVEAAKVCYISGFFLTVSVDSIVKVAKHCVDANKVFTMNLSAAFVPALFKGPLETVLPYVDILFGNEGEAESLSNSFGYGTSDLKEIARHIASIPKVNGERKRVVIITQGPGPVILFNEGVVSEHPIMPISPEEIVDTNGAGDAWVGGFLSQLVLGRGLEECIRGGHYAANVIIKRMGCTFPPTPDFKLS